MESASTLREALEDREVQLLEQAVDGEQPARRRLLDLPLSELTADDLNELRDSVGTLLTKYGFDRNWEPNPFGLECEDLIDRIAPWHWGKDN